MTLVYADNPKGYICRLRRCDLLEVPDTVEKFDSVLTILASVLNAKVRFMLFVLFFIIVIQKLTYLKMLVCSTRDGKDGSKRSTNYRIF
jgi:hypothetical protein